MTTEPFPELSTAPMMGDAAIVRDVNSSRPRRQRQGRRSIFTDVVEEAAAFRSEMREEFRKMTPAPYMQEKQTAEQRRTRLKNISPEEALMRAKLEGLPFFEEMARISGNGSRE